MDEQTGQGCIPTCRRHCHDTADNILCRKPNYTINEDIKQTDSLHGQPQKTIPGCHHPVGRERAGRHRAIHTDMAYNARTACRFAGASQRQHRGIRPVDWHCRRGQRGALFRLACMFASRGLPRGDQHPQGVHGQGGGHATRLLRHHNERPHTQGHRRQRRSDPLVCGPPNARPRRNGARAGGLNSPDHVFQRAAGPGLPHPRGHCHGHHGPHHEHARA